ncbi:MAG: nitrate reductase catalytic subunit [Planctomycetaceae bacterium]|nr:MAG: nitrate reductase catalytic subunit [Planctomycetaceae bacterium]
MKVLGEGICPYCGVGCRLRYEGDHTGVARVRGVETAAANLGRLCAKGAQLGPTLHTADRLTSPWLREDRQAPLRPASWEEALAFVVRRLRRLLFTWGPQTLAFYGSGQLDTETVYAVSKLFKGMLGCNNTDSNSRLCMAAAVAGYRTSLGSDGPPCCYDDIELADVVLIIGSNMAEAHPVLFDRLRASLRERPHQQLIVVDPRRTPTAEAAHLHLALRPGADIALLNAWGKWLLEHGVLDESFVAQHTQGFAQYREFLSHQNWDELVAATGLAASEIEQAAQWLGQARNFLSFYCMGMNQSTVGMWKNNSLINLHLLLGQIGKPGAGPFSLTGQPNAMGGREAGLLSHQLPGYRLVEDATHREELERYWGLPAGRIHPQPGFTAVEMFRALEKKQLRGIWIAATNPVVSLPDLHQVRRALAQAELIIVQDAYHPTETTALADVVLPAAQWAEKEWTSTNSERMVSYSPQLFEPPGEALPDWQIVARVARALGFAGFSWPDAAAVWDEFICLTRGRPCDMSGITSRRLRREGCVPWPCPAEDHPGTKRLYLDRRFPTRDGRAVFLPRDHRNPHEQPDHEFPFILTTGRIYTHWHTLTRTAKADKLWRRESQPYLELHPDDAREMGVNDGDLLQISSRRGTVQLPARVTSAVTRGLVFAPFHWGDAHAPGQAVNYLTISATGRVAKQPELKFCAVNVEKVRCLNPPDVPPADSLLWLRELMGLETDAAVTLAVTEDTPSPRDHSPLVSITCPSS